MDDPQFRAELRRRLWDRHLLLHPSTLILVAINLVPLIGVIWWGWDAFVLLMLYWLETAIIAFWTIVRIALLPPGELGGLELDAGGTKTTSPLAIAAFFTLHCGIFMGVHLMFLFALFSGGWSKRIHGVGDFTQQIVVATGLWLPLAVLFVGRGAVLLFERLQPMLRRMLGRPQPKSARPDPQAPGQGESVVIALYLRIVIMQVTIIVGAWFALLLGSIGPFILLIAIKTFVDVSIQVVIDTVRAAMKRARANTAAGG